ncbi:hypothetical protein [Terrimonas ferruginea]|uniref:hypothetical protein n=1 Tax=Terrimonas ferruginea TaxID=249 RepID=UPI000411010D|nr:hypothetical protein [Terrimonas ferruginea]
MRIFQGRSPFSPDRNHIHHLLLDRCGMGHAAVTLTCVGVNVFFIMLAYSCRSMNPSLLLFLLLAVAFTGLSLLYLGRRPRQRRLFVAKSIREPQPAIKSAAPSKIVPLTQQEAAKVDQH